MPPCSVRASGRQKRVAYNLMDRGVVCKHKRVAYNLMDRVESCAQRVVSRVWIETEACLQSVPHRGQSVPHRGALPSFSGYANTSGYGNTSFLASLAHHTSFLASLAHDTSFLASLAPLVLLCNRAILLCSAGFFACAQQAGKTATRCPYKHCKKGEGRAVDMAAHLIEVHRVAINLVTGSSKPAIHTSSFPIAFREDSPRIEGWISQEGAPLQHDTLLQSLCHTYTHVSNTIHCCSFCVRRVVGARHARIRLPSHSYGTFLSET